MSNTQEFWAKYARAYDEVMGSYSRHKSLIDVHLEALAGCNTVLESGCGPGHLTKRLLEKGHRVYAVDINSEALRLLREKCGDNPNLSIECVDANNLSYQNEFFDGVSSMLVLWAMENPKKYLAEQRRVLKPNGKLVISGPGPETRDRVDYQLKMFREDLEEQGLFPEIQKSWDDFLQYTAQNVCHTAENWFTNREISDLLEDTGFEIKSIKPNPIYCGQGHVIVASKVTNECLDYFNAMYNDDPRSPMSC